jgi:hypothetical protein
MCLWRPLCSILLEASKGLSSEAGIFLALEKVSFTWAEEKREMPGEEQGTEESCVLFLRG